MSTVRIILYATLAALVSSCTTTQTHRQLRARAAHPSPTSYYQSVTQQSAPVPQNASTETFTTELQHRILKRKADWTAAMSQAAPESKATAFTPGPNLAAAKLAASSNIQERLKGTPDIVTLELLAREWNPDVHAARKKVEALLEQYPQAAYLDGILQQYNAFTKQLQTGAGPQGHKQMVAETFPFPDALALKGDITTQDVLMGRIDEERTLRDVLTRLRVACYELLFVESSLEITRENQELLKQIIEVAQAKMKADRAGYNSVVSAQVELSKLADMIITLEDRERTQTARINTLLNRKADASLGMPSVPAAEELDIDLEGLTTRAVANRQELQKLRIKIARTSLMIQLAGKMAYPDATLGASYLENRMKPDYKKTTTESTGFANRRDLNHRMTPWFGERDAYIREIRVTLDAMGKDLGAAENEVTFQANRLSLNMETAKRSLALYIRELLPQADQALQAAGAGYRSGKTDFLTFLDAQRTLLKFRLEEQRALRDLRQSIARLEQLAGTPLPKRRWASSADNKPNPNTK